MAVLLGLVALATLTPFLLAGMAFLKQYVDNERNAQLDRLRGHAAALARTVDRDLGGFIETARVLAGSRSLADGDLTEFEELARDAAAMAGGHFILVDRALRQIVNTRAVSRLGLPPAADLASVVRVFETARPVVSNLGIGAVAKELLFTVRVPVMVGGEVRYVLGYAPRTSAMPSLLMETYRPDGWLAAITDASARVIARSHRHEEFLGQPAAQDVVRRTVGAAGLIDVVDLEGRKSLSAYHRSALSQWTVYVWAPTVVLETPANQAFFVILLLLGCALVASLGVAVLTGRLVARPTVRLVTAAHDLAARRPVRFQPSLMREANVVGRALVDASDDVGFVMRELSHRSKNLLSVVQAVARQTAISAADTEDFKKRFGQRLAALAHSHDLLVDRDWRGVCLVDLVKTQIMSFAGENGAQLSVCGPPVLMTPACAQHLGMALHELATNAAKHGALSASSGHVEISWTWQSDEDGKERLAVRWEETGGPPVAPPARKGFGHVVVVDMVAAGVNGRADIEWRREGLVWTLDADASCAQRCPE